MEILLAFRYEKIGHALMVPQGTFYRDMDQYHSFQNIKKQASISFERRSLLASLLFVHWKELKQCWNSSTIVLLPCRDQIEHQARFRTPMKRRQGEVGLLFLLYQPPEKSINYSFFTANHLTFIFFPTWFNRVSIATSQNSIIPDLYFIPAITILITLPVLLATQNRASPASYALFSYSSSSDEGNCKHSPIETESKEPFESLDHEKGTSKI